MYYVWYGIVWYSTVWYGGMGWYGMGGKAGQPTPMGKKTTMHLPTKPAEYPIVLDNGSYGWHGSDRGDRLD